MIGGVVYKFLYVIVRTVMFFWHPVFRVAGRENVPKDGRFLICPNHSGLADPIWVLFALRLGHIPRIMAKKELLKVPVLSRFLQKIGVIFVDRQGNDILAIKAGLRCLREEQQLMIFPEGKRVRDGEKAEPKRGALLLAQRTDSPILPVYLTKKRRPFSPMDCVIGEPYRLAFPSEKPTDLQMQQAAEALMAKIYEMGERL